MSTFCAAAGVRSSDLALLMLVAVLPVKFISNLDKDKAYNNIKY